MTLPRFTGLLLAALLSPGCGGQHATGDPAAPQEVALAGGAAGHGAPAQAAEQVPVEPFKNGKQVFDKVRDTLLKNYVHDNLSEDDLYRAATQGMLENADPGMRSWNKLLSPSEIADLHHDTSGELVGIGVEIKFDSPSGISDVLGVLPGSPAEKAGLQEGDKILDVNGKFYKGLTLRDVVADIRGKAGERVRLTLLRGDKLLTKDAVRAHMTYDSVSHMVLPGQVGYLAIQLFSESTPDSLRKALGEFSAQKVRALVIDLRNNEGGLFDKAVESAGLFLPNQAPIVKVTHRGGQEETFTAQADPPLSGVPVALLVNGATASGAELFTGALRDGIAAQVIGQKTFGKWSAQMLETLDNGYAIKYTSGLFRTPGGKSYQGSGLLPDVEVPGVGQPTPTPTPTQEQTQTQTQAQPQSPSQAEDRQVELAQRIKQPDKRLAADPPLRTAVSIALLRAH